VAVRQTKYRLSDASVVRWRNTETYAVSVIKVLLDVLYDIVWTARGMRKLIGYARVSTDDQKLSPANTTSPQISKCATWLLHAGERTSRCDEQATQGRIVSLLRLRARDPFCPRSHTATMHP